MKKIKKIKDKLLTLDLKISELDGIKKTIFNIIVSMLTVSNLIIILTTSIIVYKDLNILRILMIIFKYFGIIFCPLIIGNVIRKRIQGIKHQSFEKIIIIIIVIPVILINIYIALKYSNELCKIVFSKSLSNHINDRIPVIYVITTIFLYIFIGFYDTYSIRQKRIYLTRYKIPKQQWKKKDNVKNIIKLKNLIQDRDKKDRLYYHMDYKLSKSIEYDKKNKPKINNILITILLAAYTILLVSIYYPMVLYLLK